MSAYDEPTEPCPYCNTDMKADWVDVGVGSVQCGPYHCCACGASEIGPELHDWYYKDRAGNTLMLTGRKKYYEFAKKKIRKSHQPILRYNHPFKKAELDTGYYQGRLSPYANTVNGQLVNHIDAKAAYLSGDLDEKVLPQTDDFDALLESLNQPSEQALNGGKTHVTPE